MAEKHHRLPFASYRGAAPFLFVSYSHRDTGVVYDELQWLHDQGVKVWYDEGISPGQVWPRELAQTINRCSLLVLFVSQDSIKSSNCLREVHYAIERDKPILAVHLEEISLPDELQFVIGDRQAILKPRLSQQMYREKLLAGIGEQLGTVQDIFEESPEEAPAVSTEPSAEARDPTSDIQVYPARMRQWLAVMLVTGLLAVGYVYWQKVREVKWLDTKTTQLNELISQDNYPGAYDVALEIEQRSGTDSVDRESWDELTASARINTNPPGVAVSFRRYGEDVPLLPLGQTPLDRVRLPKGVLEFVFDKSGYADQHRVFRVPSPLFMTNDNPQLDTISSLFADNFSIKLLEADKVPADMVVVGASTAPLSAYGYRGPIRTPAFLVDRLETTNAEYQAFVDDGGYENPAYWKGLSFVEGDTSLDWREAVPRFVDSTGRPGPANWELGRFPDGTARQPVHGVSWFEAMAYARYRNKRLLPLVYWTRTSFALMENVFPVTPQKVMQSNFSGTLSDAGTSGALGPYGTIDTAGNVAEWVYNARGLDRLVMGGSASDVPYILYHVSRASPWDRNQQIGIRAYRDLEPADPALFEARPGYTLAEPPAALTNEAFKADVQSYQYVRFDPEPLVESETDIHNGRYRLVTLKRGSGDERYPVHIYLPDRVSAPFQALLFMGGSDSQQPSANLLALEHPLYMPMLQRMLRSGRAVVWPEWYGTYSRLDGIGRLSPEQQRAAWRERYRNWLSETDSVITYLNATGEFEEEFAWMGFSMGAIYPVPRLLYQVPQLATAVLFVAGNRLADPVSRSYIENITKPVLMLNGRYDTVIPPSISQQLFDHLGTPDEHKKLVYFDTGHNAPPGNQMAREVDDWLNNYLGPVTRR